MEGREGWLYPLERKEWISFYRKEGEVWLGERPVKAHSGRTSRSRFWGAAAARSSSARAMFSLTWPSSEANWRHAMRIVGRIELSRLGRHPPRFQTLFVRDGCT